MAGPKGLCALAVVLISLIGAPVSGEEGAFTPGNIQQGEYDVKDIAKQVYEKGRERAEEVLSNVRLPGRGSGSGRREGRRERRISRRGGYGGSFDDFQKRFLGDKPISQHVEDLTNMVKDIDYDKHINEVRGHVDHVSAAAMGKASRHTLPHVAKFGEESKETVHYVVRKYIPTQFVGATLNIVSWTLVLVPLVVAVSCLYCIVATSFVQKALLFANLYLTVYCVLLAAATFVVQHEPMAMLQQYSEDSYVTILLTQACFYAAYLCFQLFSVFSLQSVSCCTRIAYSWQLIIGIVVGLHYYFMLWHPSMLDLPTHMDWVFYSFYAVAFGAMGALSRAAMLDKRRLEARYQYFDEEEGGYMDKEG